VPCRGFHALVGGGSAVRSKNLPRIWFHRARECFNRVSSREAQRIGQLGLDRKAKRDSALADSPFVS
jgi:hypothetical protein